ncbi:glycogen synthase GlgA [Pseudobacteroides cellulosolvens]|uniref:Glycogen synthase n=1 Tax=Pseudobacteroides cellulosolvens ATCC 35603 = DSM 2933 TaxID=398512 RepID=A0A0L6JP77_9FIRM|nr:glycogen synthase GlgA [Pseudobacteroides cellulosolvens]KNY27167.1 Glycogen synthase [Pseudobacteroides cellulosolvens ATCC 35603 = DSM 2933]
MENLKILFASSEVVPFAKTGGLADVAGSLPKAIKAMGTDIRVVMPKYKCIDKKYTDKMELISSFYVNIVWRRQLCGVYKLVKDNVDYYFIENDFYFNRDGLYGYFDQAEQFTFFNRALLEMLPHIGFQPDVVHFNDWQTGIGSLLLESDYKELKYYKDMKSLFTIHNIKYQGIFPKEIMDSVLGLSWEYFHLNGLEHNDQVNFMKAGIAYSSIVNTVSKTYADEIKHDFFGEGLNGIINRRAGDVYGILNGIDYDHNNPSTDKRLYVNYSSRSINGKYENKKMLQEELKLPVKDVPMVGIISRLVDQKGFDLIDCVIMEILQMDLQLVVLGTGEYKYENMFRWASEVYPEKVSANIKYDDVLAQRIYASSDIFLMPSLFEPCGLSQMFSMRYGTIPLVRETGGLNDTVRPYNEFTGEGNGFTFANYNAHDMLYTIRRAVEIYQNKPIWEMLVKRVMKEDFRWEKSASEYVELYRRAMEKE